MQDEEEREGRDIKKNRETTTTSDSRDVATILSQLPNRGTEDDVSRLMDLYESAERKYRAGMKANSPRVGSSASANA